MTTKTDELPTIFVEDTSDPIAWCGHATNMADGQDQHFVRICRPEGKEPTAVVMSYEAFACLFHFAEKGGMGIHTAEEE